jgi:hypothetical protein
MPPPELTPYATPGFAVASVPGATIIPLQWGLLVGKSADFSRRLTWACLFWPGAGAWACLPEPLRAGIVAMVKPVKKAVISVQPQ